MSETPALGICRDSGRDTVDLDRHVERVFEVAKEERREDVMDNFCATLLRWYVSEHHAARSPRDIFASLQCAVDCREEIHEIERNMDKAHFVELITGGFFVAGGEDKATGLPLFWLQLGLIEREVWKYKRGSPRGLAYVRAHIFFTECALVETIPNNPEPGFAFFIDDSERRMLDFQFDIHRHYVGFFEKLTLGIPKRVAMAGTNRFWSAILAVFQKVAPVFGRCFSLIDHGEVEEYVVNPKDVPMFWYGDDEGKPYISTDRRNVWCYERCLSEENRITSKDVYNPGPWPYEEVDYEALEERKESRASGALETIAEEEDDEW